jgi:uncharacterized protein (TIRG00374 family)
LKIKRRTRLWNLSNLLWLLLPVMLAWALRDIPLADIRATLSVLNPGAILALIFLNVGIFTLFSSRWWLILQAQGYTINYFSLVSYRLAAFGICYFTPGSQFGGEPLQVYLLQAHQRVPGSTALASVTLDKLFELLANFTFMAIGIVLILNGGFVASLNSQGAVLLIAGLLILPLGYLLSLWTGRFPLAWLAGKLPGPLVRFTLFAKIRPLIDSVERQISSLCRQKPYKILGILLLSLLTWVLLLGEYWLTLMFLGLPLNLIQAIIALTAARIAFLTPLPGGLGALEASQVLAMGALGLNPAVGISISLMIRARDLTFGGIGLWWIGILSRLGPVKPAETQASN